MTIKSAQNISARQDTINPEAGIAYVAVLSGRAGHVYSPLASPPYTPQPYGPLYYGVNALIARASHLDVDVTLRRGRFLTFGCFLLCGLTVYLVGRALRFCHRDSALAGLMLIGQPAFLPWDISMRPDLPSLLVMLFSLLVALREAQLGQVAYVLSGLLAGSAFLIKQSALALPVAIIAILLMRRKFRETGLFAGAAAASLALAFGILLGLREPFGEHFASVGRSLWSLGAGAGWTMQFLGETSNAVPLAIGGIGFFFAIATDERSQMIAAFALVNLCAGLVSITNLGGAANYFLPALAGCALLLPFAIRAISDHSQAPMVTSVLAIVGLLSATAGGVAAIRGFQLPGFVELQKAGPERLHAFRIISDVPYIAMHGHDPELLDPFLMHTLELTKRWDPAGFLESVRQDTDLVILTCGRVICSFRGISKFGAPFVNSVNKNYEVLCSADLALVLKARARSVAATPKELSAILGEPCIASLDRAPHLSLAHGAR